MVEVTRTSKEIFHCLTLPHHRPTTPPPPPSTPTTPTPATAFYFPVLSCCAHSYESRRNLWRLPYIVAVSLTAPTTEPLGRHGREVHSSRSSTIKYLSENSNGHGKVISNSLIYSAPFIVTGPSVWNCLPFSYLCDMLRLCLPSSPW